MSHGRKIRNADEARAALDAIEHGGHDRVAWARAHNIDARSLNAWRLNLRRGQATPFRLVELVADTAIEPYVPSNAGCTVRYGDFVVEVDVGVDEETLARVLRAVRRC